MQVIKIDISIGDFGSGAFRPYISAQTEAARNAAAKVLLQSMQGDLAAITKAAEQALAAVRQTSAALERCLRTPVGFTPGETVEVGDSGKGAPA